MTKIHADAMDVDALVGIAAMWKAGESFQNQCVIMNLTTNRLETTSCFAQYAYLCYSSNEAGI